MEMLIIDKSVLGELLNRIETLKIKLDRLYKQSGMDSQTWVDNQQACRMLCACKRTLQNLRESGMLPFSKVGGKLYYKPADIERLFQAGYVKNEK